MKAFEIEPKLKPDMSRFLIHMTGKDAIKSILNGGRHKEEGLIRAQVPNGPKSESFNHKISCFTETPIFALGGFVAISKRRNAENMQYGVGFRKFYMVEHNVRPTIYLDNEVLGQLFKAADADSSDGVNSLLDTLKSLAHPLGEKMPLQGFTWEREWRFIDETGFYFDYDAIEVICCPKEEQPELLSILGRHSERIRFVDSWAHYKEHTQHIKHTDFKEKISNALSSHDEFKTDEFLENYEDHVSSLNLYRQYLLSLQNNANDIDEKLQELKEWKQYIDANTASFCGHFSENLIWRSDFEESFCPECSSDFNEGLAKAMRED